MREIGAIILAAGASNRLGHAKQLVPIGGVPLLRRTAEISVAAGIGRTVVVLGANRAACEEVVRGCPVHVVINTDWPTGMASSIRSGLIGLTELLPSVEGALLLVCDQLMLSPQILVDLVRRFQQGPEKVVASSYAGRIGVPALFGRASFPSLMELQGDHGARALLRCAREPVATLPFPGGERDLDTTADLTRA